VQASKHRQPFTGEIRISPAEIDKKVEKFIMSTKTISVLGVVLGVVAGALIAIVSGSWMFWLALGVALGLLLGGVQRKRDLRPNNRPNFRRGASI